MKRGRKPKASAVKRRDGNPGKRPLNPAEPKPPTPAKPPRAPTHLDANGKREWRRLTKLLQGMGVLTEADLNLAALYCETWSNYLIALEHVQAMGQAVTEDKDGGFTVKRNPWSVELHKYKRELVALGSEFGLSPTSRTRLQSNREPEENDPLMMILQARASEN